MTDAPRYIVTGGCGFVGSNLVAALRKRDPQAEITIIDDFRSGSFANVIEACDRLVLPPFSGRVFPMNLTDVLWDGLLDRPCTALFHLGAITDTTLADQAEMLRVNTDSFWPMLEACAAADVPLVYASSAATYGTPPEVREKRPFREISAGKPDNIYGFSKWLMECEHRRFEEERSHKELKPAWIVGLRYFNVFGPGEGRKGRMASMVFQLARQLLEGKRPRLFTDGSQARDQVYVEDVVACTMAAAGLGARPDPAPGVYNLGSGRATSFNEINAALRSALGIAERERPTEYFEMPPPIAAFYQSYTCADMTRAREGLGFTPAWDASDAISRYARYLKARAG